MSCELLSHLLRQQISLSYIYANVHGIDVGLAGRILTEPSSSELLLMSIIFFLKNKYQNIAGFVRELILDREVQYEGGFACAWPCVKRVFVVYSTNLQHMLQEEAALKCLPAKPCTTSISLFFGFLVFTSPFSLHDLHPPTPHPVAASSYPCRPR